MKLETIGGNMSTETKDKLTSEESKKLLDIADIIHKAFIAARHVSLPEIENKETMAEMFKDLLKERLPGLELREEVSEEIERWKKAKESGAYSPEEITENVRRDIDREAKLYIDSAKHIMMYNRRYIEDTLENDISEIIGKEEIKVEDLYRVAKIAFDLNGLKTLNDAAGHDVGNNALEIFSKILKEGTTSKWLRNQGIRVIPAHQSGDEFILLMYGEKDLSPIIEEVTKRYEEEVKSVDVSQLMDFPAAKKYLEGLKIYDKFLNEVSDKTGLRAVQLEDKFSKEFKFQLGTSVGIVTLGEALAQINPADMEGKNYKGISRSIIGNMFGIADKKALAHKKISKAALADKDPLLGVVINRNVEGSDKDNTEERANLLLKNSQLEVEVADLQKRIAMLEAQMSAK